MLEEEFEAAAVPSSLMPEGVEHIKRFFKARDQTTVPSSLMPEGVEHVSVWLAVVPPAVGAELVDAGRR